MIDISKIFSRRRKPVYSCFRDHNLPNANGKPVKPSHDSEMLFTFDTFERNLQQSTDYDRNMVAAVIEYWTNFPKPGDPNAPGHALWLP